MIWSRVAAVPVAVATAAVLGGLGGPATAWASGAPAPAGGPGPVVLSAGATPGNLPAGGGVVAVAATVRNATTCQLELLSKQSFPVVFSSNARSCADGRFSAQVTVGPNSTEVQRTVAFALMAKNGTASSLGRFFVLLAGAKPAAVVSLSVTPPKLAAAGGPVTVTATVENASTCQLQLLSKQAFPVVFSGNARSCTTGDFAAKVTIGANTTRVLRTIAFSLTATQGLSHAVHPFYISLAAGSVTAKGGVPAITNQPSVAASSSPPASTQSSNWSGYSITGGPFTAVKGTFTVPSVAPGTPTYDQVAEWVGVDGANNADTSLIQAGVDEFSDPSSSTGFDLQAWWEILPAAETNITTVTVRPGDSITVTLWQMSSSSWEINLSDNTNRESYTTPPEPYSGPGSTAEWIVEATTRCSFRCVTAELAPYTPAVAFTNLGMTGPEGALQEDTMVQRQGVVSTPTALTARGFNVAYTGQQLSARPEEKIPG